MNLICKKCFSSVFSQNSILNMTFRACSNKIIKIDNLNPVLALKGQIDKNALVVWDVDRTLIVPNNPLAADTHYSYVRRMGKEIVRNLTLEKQKKWERGFFHSLIYINAKNKVIDNQSIRFIEDLNSTNIKTIALTALARGSFGAIEDVLDWRIQDLRSLGYDFSKGFSDECCYQFKKEVPNDFLAFRKGVLFSSSSPKGIVLEVFLKRIGWTPSHLYFIDDQEPPVQSVDERMNHLGIPSTIFHYTEASEINSVLDEKLAYAQLNHLIHKEEWPINI